MSYNITKKLEAEIDLLARTIYAEARGEYSRLDGGLSSLIAIGNVVLNRVQQQTWYGKTVTEVCLKPWQFSCWNPHDPNQVLLSAPLTGKIFETCQRVSKNLIEGRWPDITGGCDHYHASTLKTFPKWTLNAKPKYRIGRHIFYDLRSK